MHELPREDGTGAANPRPSPARALASFWTRGRTIERTGYAVAALLCLSGLLHICLLVASGGSWEGPVSLRKAATFGLSFGLTLASITWVVSLLRLEGRTHHAMLAVFVAACVLETALVSMQVWRQVPSHFNVEKPFDALVARTLAAGGFALIATIVTFLVAACRANPRVPLSLRVASRFGFVLLTASLATGAVMIARGMRLVFAGHATTAYATAGALKPTHAVTMHAILLLPALAWLLSFVDWTERRRVRVVLAAAIGYVVLAAVTAAENLLGLPLGSPLGISLSGFGALALVAAGGVVIRGLARQPSVGIEHE